MGTDPTVLVVQHQDDCPPALFGEWLTEAGCTLDVRRPYAGDPLPDDLGQHQGFVVLGGSMGADDDADHDWLGPTKQLVRSAARVGVPTVGICLGHQVAAVALGGRVEAAPHGRQFGVLAIGWGSAAADDPLLGSRPASCIHWNNDVVTVLPPGATALAHAPDGSVQVARLAGCVWGVQPHPEVDESIVSRWALDERDEIGPELTDTTLAEMVRRGPDLVREWRPVAAAFAQLLTS